LEVPLIKQLPVNPLLNGRVEADGAVPQAIVIPKGAVMVGKVAGLTVIVLDTGATILPHASVAVQVSVTCPPHAPGVVVNVEGKEFPVSWQFPPR
jgi:hypothetical protein